MTLVCTPVNSRRYQIAAPLGFNILDINFWSYRGIETLCQQHSVYLYFAYGEYNLIAETNKAGIDDKALLLNSLKSEIQQIVHHQDPVEIDRTIWFPGAVLGKVIPKARPRGGGAGGKFFMPANYVICQKTLIKIIKSIELVDISQSKNLEFFIGFFGETFCNRSDLDNLAGTILDASTKAGLIHNDNASIISGLILRAFHHIQVDGVLVSF